VIGATYQASFDAKNPPAISPESAGEVEVKVEKKPSAYEEVTVATIADAQLLDISGDAAEAVAGAESHLFDVPAVAIECKTYLDKTMLEGSSRAAEEIKARHPNGLYIVVMEYIKLTEAVNLRKYKVDQIYVLRKQKNTDREYRYLPSFTQNPIDYATVEHLFNTVRTHLVKDWTGDVASGLERGWLIE
jgi:ribosomal protein L32E